MTMILSIISHDGMYNIVGGSFYEKYLCLGYSSCTSDIKSLSSFSTHSLNFYSVYILLFSRFIFSIIDFPIDKAILFSLFYSFIMSKSFIL